MRVAVGVDIVEVSRVARLLADHPAAESELFTESEQRHCASRKQRMSHLAARFAAKEAVYKALGTGLGPGDRWTDVEIGSDPLGCPHVTLHGGPQTRVGALGGSVEVSLSHTGNYAIAHAVVVFPSI